MVQILSHGNFAAFYDSIHLVFDRGVVIGARLTESVTIDYYSRLISIPADYEWDGSSLPGGRYLKIGNRLDYLFASLVHDYLYGEQPEWAWRFYADYIYGRLMKLEGAPGWQACLRTVVLWLFGWKAWLKNKIFNETKVSS